MWHPKKKKKKWHQKTKKCKLFSVSMCLGIMQERLKARPGYDKALIIDVFEESPSTIAVTEGQPTRVLIGETLVV